MADTNLSFSILAKDNASSTITKVGQKFGALHMSVGAVAKGIALVGPALAGLAVGAGLKDFINEARESRRIGEITANVIKTTGGAAKVTAKQVGDLATAISNKTGADDEAVQSGQNMLLTFTNIRNGVGKTNKIFDQASQTVVDMAAAMNNGEVSSDGVKTASIQLGKALQDPIKGITALRKVGVSFTEDQQKQIKTLVESGKTMEAQKIILGELGKEFGGTAAAAADPMQKLEVVVGNVKETIGAQFLPVVDKASTWLAERLPGAVATSGRFFKENLLPPLQRVSDFTTKTLIPGVGKIVTTFQGLGSRIVKAIGPVDVAGIGKTILEEATGWAKGLITGFKTGVTKGDWKPLGTAISDGLAAAVGALRTNGGKIIDAIGAWLDSIDWSRIGGKISNAFTGMLKAVEWKRIGSTLGDALIEMIRKTADLGVKLGTAFKEVVAKVDWKQVGRDSTSAIGQFVSGVDWASLGKIVATSAVKGLKINAEIRQTIVNSVADVLIGAYNELGEWGKKKAEEWGPKLWDGLKSGIVSGAKGIGGWVKVTFIDPFVRWTKQALGIKSPSTVFAAIGAQVVAGFKGGIAGAARGIGSWIYTTAIVPAVTPFMKSGTWLVQHGKNAVGGFKRGVGEIATGIGRWVYERVAVPVVSPFAKAGSWLSRAGRDLIGGLTGGIATRMKGIGGWIKAQVVDPIVSSVKNFFGIKSPSTVFAGIGGNLVAGLFKGMGSGVGAAIAKKVFGDMPSALRSIVGKGLISVSNLPKKALDALGSSIGIGAPLGGPSGNASNEGIVRTLATQYGWGSGAQWNSLRALIMGESGFRNTAQNPTSSAYGMFQFLDSTWGTVGASKTSDPWAQTVAGLKYIARSYGSPANAYSKWASRSPHWYEKGTPWVPNDQLAYLHEGEAVLPRKVNEARLRGAGGQSVDITLRVAPGGDSALAQVVHKLIRTNVIQLSVDGKPVKVAGG